MICSDLMSLCHTIGAICKGGTSLTRWRPFQASSGGQYPTRLCTEAISTEAVMYNHLGLSFFNKSHKGLGIASRTKRNTIRNRNTGTKELPGFVSEHSLLKAIALPHNLQASVNSAKTMSFRCMHHWTCPMNVARVVVNQCKDASS